MTYRFRIRPDIADELTAKRCGNECGCDPNYAHPYLHSDDYLRGIADTLWRVANYTGDTSEINAITEELTRRQRERDWDDLVVHIKQHDGHGIELVEIGNVYDQDEQTVLIYARDSRDTTRITQMERAGQYKVESSFSSYYCPTAYMVLEEVKQLVMLLSKLER